MRLFGLNIKKWEAMMLSSKLKSLHGKLNQYTDSGVAMDCHGVKRFCAVLKAAIEEAESLECGIVPTAGRIKNPSDNVTRLATVLDRRGVRTGARLPGQKPEGAA